MSDTKQAFTPGPWQVNGWRTGPRCAEVMDWKNKNGEQDLVIRGAGYPDCPEAGPTIAVLPISEPTANADAYLIAAAPDMYEALTEVLGNVRKRKGTDGEGRLSIHDITIIKAAIAKAEGQP